MSAEDRIEKAMEVASQYGQIQGDHHRAWTIDQMVRALLGDGYEAFVVDYENGEEDEWNVGIAP